MVTLLSGGTGTPKLLAGARETWGAGDLAVVCNTGDDVELGGLVVCPDVDTVLYEAAGRLDRETWWGVDGDSSTGHAELAALGERVPDEDTGYLPEDRQTAGRHLAAWRRFSGLGEFMHVGDRDRALHVARTSLLDAGHDLTAATRRLADALGVASDVVPMSDDPVASIVHAPDGPLHFQAFWVRDGGAPTVEDVEFRGADVASASPAAVEAVREGPVVVGPSNPVTSLGPMLALDGLREALEAVPVVAVSPFVEDQVFSGPAAELLAATGREPSTAGVAEAYPFADAFVLDEADGTDLDRPVVRTDTRMADRADSERVAVACRRALEVVG